MIEEGEEEERGSGWLETAAQRNGGGTEERRLSGWSQSSGRPLPLLPVHPPLSPALAIPPSLSINIDR